MRSANARVFFAHANLLAWTRGFMEWKRIGALVTAQLICRYRQPRKKLQRKRLAMFSSSYKNKLPGFLLYFRLQGSTSFIKDPHFSTLPYEESLIGIRVATV